MEPTVDAAVYHDFYFKLALPMRLPPTARRVLQEFVDIDVNSPTIAQVIAANPYVHNCLMQLIVALGPKETLPGLQTAILLLGMQGTRDFVCALQMQRGATGRFVKTGKDGKPELQASEIVKFARKAEEHAAEHRVPAPDLAYAAGLMFDQAVLVGRHRFGAQKAFEEYAATVFSHGLKSARIAVELVRGQMGDVGISRFLFAACLVHDIGKLALELLFPPDRAGSYQAFRAELAKAKGGQPPRVARHLLEERKFGLTHEYYGAQMCYHFKALREVGRGVLFHHDPYLGRSAGEEVLSLASWIAVASNVANHFQPPKGDGDPIAKRWIPPEIGPIGVRPRAIADVIAMLGSESF